MTTYKGIIFDFNGVLWWDNDLQEQSWKEFSAAVRGTSLSNEEMAIHMHGRNNQYTQEYLLGRPVTGDELEQLIRKKETIYQQLCLAQGTDFKLSPGAVELLDFLVDQHIPHTIATASGKINLDFFIQHLDLGRWFNLDQVVYDDGSITGKPAPDIYLKAAKIWICHQPSVWWLRILIPAFKRPTQLKLDGLLLWGQSIPTSSLLR